MLGVAFTPLCWGMILYVFRKARAIAALDVGLPNELLNEVERHSWVGAVVVALALSSVVNGLLEGL
jgi:hypothetical protein